MKRDTNFNVDNQSTSDKVSYSKSDVKNIKDLKDLKDVKDEPIIVDTSQGAKDGQEKCPRCGSTDISLNPETAQLRCEFCRYEFEPQKVVGMQEDISKLKGKIIGSGAQNIQANTKDIITLKCQSCGAEVVIDSSVVAQARCHWCRNTLSLNEQIPNGAIPDMVLPFKVIKDDAKTQIQKFVNKRSFFAHPKFKEEFKIDNIMGVYFPYMLVDINGRSYLRGEGEHTINTYRVKKGDKYETRHDVDVYDIQRKFDIRVTDLSLESSADRLDKHARGKTNNIINSIMPFDTENCVKWSANYIKGFSSEKRDVNIDHLENSVVNQVKDIAKYKMTNTIEKYDRGVRWDDNELEVIGEQWNAAYLPVWLYSYQQKKGSSSLIHYIAVNARTKETMGSVPVYMPKLFGVSLLVEIISLVLMFFIDFGDDFNGEWVFFLPGIAFFLIIFFYYRNTNARHSHESETFAEIDNLQTQDDYIQTKRGVKGGAMFGANSKSFSGKWTFKF